MSTKPVLRRSLVQGLLSCTEYRSTGGANAAFGSALHDFAASYWATCRAHNEESRLADVETLARDAFFRLPRGLDPARLDEFKALAEKFARDHLAALHELVGYELTLTADVGFALLTGTLDRLDRIDGGDPDDPPTRMRVTDFKTQWPTEDHLFQMRFYAGMVALTYPAVEEVETQVDHVRTGAIVTEAYDRATLLAWWDEMLHGLRTRLEHEAARLRITVEQVATMIGAGEELRGSPTGGAACQWCSKRLRCGAAAAPFNAAPENDDQAEEIFSTMVRAEATSDDAKAALKVYFAERGPAVFNGLEVGFLQPHEPRFEAREPWVVWAWLQHEGLDWTAAMSIDLDPKALPKYIRQQLVDAGIAEMVMGAPSFKHRKAKEV